MEHGCCRVVVVVVRAVVRAINRDVSVADWKGQAGGMVNYSFPFRAVV